MDQRARALAVSGIDATLSALGYEDTALRPARGDVVDWARTRLQAWQGKTGVVRGLRILVTGRGRAELRPFDRPLAIADQVTVEVLASALSPGTERAQWLRLPNARLGFPYAPGYSAAGRVIRAGEKAGHLSEGELVAIQKLPHASVGTVPATAVTPVPDGVPPEHAALVYLAVISGYGVRRARLNPGDSVCVIGAGTIGALAQRLAMLNDPGEVTVVARTREREQAALAHGAGSFMSADEGLEEIGARVVIEATGDPAALLGAVRAARPGGTVVLLGSPRGRTPGAALAEAQGKGLRLEGAHISALVAERRHEGGDPFQALAAAFVSGLADRSLDVADLAGPALDPREAQRSYRRLARGEIRAGHFAWTVVPNRDRATVRSPISGPALVRPRIRMRLPRQTDPPGGRVRFALIGCGDVGLHNARAIAAARNAELAIAYDPIPELAAAVASEAGGASVSELGAALDPERVDAAFLCVPHDLHAPLVEQAAGAGLDVVVEKPLAQNLADGRRAADAAESAGVALSVCFPFRYEPAMQAARLLAGDGALGELHGASVLFHMDKPESYWVGGFSGRAQSDWRGSRARAGGGVLIMNLTHYVDFMRFIAGAQPARVAAASRPAPGAEVEDAISVTIEFGNGALGTVSGSASTRGAPESRFELWGEHGTLRLEPEPAIHTERALGGIPAGRWCALPSEPAEDPRVTFVERFADAVSSGRPVDIPAVDGLAVQAFIEAAYRAAEEGTSVAVERVTG